MRFFWIFILFFPATVFAIDNWKDKTLFSFCLAAGPSHIWENIYGIEIVPTESNTKLNICPEANVGYRFNKNIAISGSYSASFYLPYQNIYKLWLSSTSFGLNLYSSKTSIYEDFKIGLCQIIDFSNTKSKSIDIGPVLSADIGYEIFKNVGIQIGINYLSPTHEGTIAKTNEQGVTDENPTISYGALSLCFALKITVF